ncbi:hypothetical protein JTE90_018035 [Oedothorax gibbosus]|uniref:Alpha-latrotoxin n=1 Tax=Oedothorax gibbosus TaxID=931172 RepID=A0AAV6V996_9ARAC|nr:hypothetical protein JTE90_018035 [Oedothorax gibbosus]
MSLYRSLYPLHHAAMYGKLRVVKKLVYKGMLTSTADFKDYTPLHYAAMYGHFNICKFLSTKCDLNALTPESWSPILLAALFGHKHIVDLLMKAGAKLAIMDDQNWSLLHSSCYMGWMDVVLEILKYNKDLDVKSAGYTALWLSAYSKDVGIFQVLLKNGADARCKDFQRWTLLHCAARSGSIEMVKSVLSCDGIDFDAQTDYGDTALFLAIYYKHINVAELLIRSGVHRMSDKCKDISIFHDACRRGSLPLVTACIEMGLDVHKTDFLGNTPLHIATSYGHSEIIKLLLQAGAKCYLKNKQDNSPFNILCQFIGNIELIELFLSHGAYFQRYDVNSLYKLTTSNSVRRVLSSVRMRTESYVSEFNNKILPKVYDVPAYAEQLPPQKNLHITSKSGILSSIRGFLKHKNYIYDSFIRKASYFKNIGSKSISYSSSKGKKIR